MEKTVAGTETSQVSRTYRRRLILLVGLATVVAVEFPSSVSFYLVGLCGWTSPVWLSAGLLSKFILLIVLHVFLLSEIWGTWVKLKRSSSAIAVALLITFQPALSLGCFYYVVIGLGLSLGDMHGYGYRDFLKRELDVPAIQTWLSTQSMEPGWGAKRIDPPDWPKCVRDVNPKAVGLSQEANLEITACIHSGHFEIIICPRDMPESPRRFNSAHVYTISPAAYLHLQSK